MATKQQLLVAGLLPHSFVARNPQFAHGGALGAHWLVAENDRLKIYWANIFVSVIALAVVGVVTSLDHQGQVFGFVFFGLGAVVVHELGHALMAIVSGTKVREFRVGGEPLLVTARSKSGFVFKFGFFGRAAGHVSHDRPRSKVSAAAILCGGVLLECVYYSVSYAIPSRNLKVVVAFTAAISVLINVMPLRLKRSHYLGAENDGMQLLRLLTGWPKRSRSRTVVDLWNFHKNNDS